MSETHTMVVEFPEGQSPDYYAGMRILEQGAVVAVDFSGDVLAERDRLAAENERLRHWQEFVRYNSKDAARMADEALAGEGKG